MRGKVVYLVTNTLGIRITPAYAGKSLLCSTKRLYNKDHPRLCGEKLKHMIKNTGGKGSPPPMRGKGLRETVYQIGDGITPAYAGKSFKPCIPSCTK